MPDPTDVDALVKAITEGLHHQSHYDGGDGYLEPYTEPPADEYVQALTTLADLARKAEQLERERDWLARRLSLVEAPTPLTGAFTLNERGEANVPKWLEAAAREAVKGE